MILEVVSYILDGNKSGNDVMKHFGITRNQFYKIKENLRIAGMPLIYDQSTKTYSVKSSAILTDDELEVVRRMGKMGLGRKQIDSILGALMLKRIPKEKRTITFSDNVIIFIIIADLHAGSDFFMEEVMDRAAEEAERINAHFILNAGDSIEGISGRTGQILTLSPDGIGITRQAKLLARVLNKFGNRPVYSIEAQDSHGGWANSSHAGSQGLNIGEYLELMSIKYGGGQYKFIGFNKVDFEVNGIIIRLLHPKKQHLIPYINGLTGSNKPHVAIMGHWHSKVGYQFHRNVHAIDAATAQATTPFIEGTGAESILGYWVCELKVEHGPSAQADLEGPFVESFNARFVPFYSRGAI